MIEYEKVAVIPVVIPPPLANVTAWIVVSDGGDDLPEYYGPFSTVEEADAFERRLIDHLMSDTGNQHPFRDGETTWEDWVHVEGLLPSSIIP